MILFKMVDSGMGTFEEVKKLDSRTVLQRIYYNSYLAEYESEFMEINRDGHS